MEAEARSIKIPFLPPHPDMEYASINSSTSGLGFPDEEPSFGTGDAKCLTSNCCFSRIGRYTSRLKCLVSLKKEAAPQTKPVLKRTKLNMFPVTEWSYAVAAGVILQIHRLPYFAYFFSLYFHFSKPLEWPKQYVATTEQHGHHYNIFKKQFTTLKFWSSFANPRFITSRGSCIPCRISIQVSATNGNSSLSLAARCYWWRYWVQDERGCKDTRRAGTVWGTRAAPQCWLWSPAQTPEQNMPQSRPSPQLWPTACVAPKQWDAGTPCSTGDRSRERH